MCDPLSKSSIDPRKRVLMLRGRVLHAAQSVFDDGLIENKDDWYRC